MSYLFYCYLTLYLRLYTIVYDLSFVCYFQNTQNNVVNLNDV